MTAVFNGSLVAAPAVNEGKVIPKFHVSGLDMASKTKAELQDGDSLKHYRLAELKPGSTVVDLGGNIGIVGVYSNLLQNMGAKCSGVFVVSVEPLPETYLMLRWNLRQNGVRELPLHSSAASKGCGGVTALNQAVTADGRNSTFIMGSRAMMARMEDALNINFDAIGSTRDNDFKTRPKVEGVAKGYRRYAVQSSSLENIVTRAGLEKVDLLKIDCEGCEYEVLQELRAKPWLVQRIKHVAGELHGCSAADQKHPKCMDALAFLRATWPHDFKKTHEVGRVKHDSGSFILV